MLQSQLRGKRCSYVPSIMDSEVRGLLKPVIKFDYQGHSWTAFLAASFDQVLTWNFGSGAIPSDLICTIQGRSMGHSLMCLQMA